MELTTLLAELRERNGSDLHLVVGQPPVFRIDGALARRDGPILDAAAMEALLLPHLTGEQRAVLTEQRQDVEIMLRWQSNPFRLHVFRERESFAAALRVIPNKVPDLSDLTFSPEVSDVLSKLMKLSRGLIIVTGPTGSGKSTTLAAMIETINRTRAERIVTIESLVEYEFTSRESLITQRAVGHDVATFPDGLRSALREDPDIVLVGELRDLETFVLALALAEIGHLVFVPMHANTTSEAIIRLVDSFPERQHRATRATLARNIQAVVAQRLLPRAAPRPGRVPANEVLIGTPRVRQMILGGHADLTVAIEAGRDVGMQTMDDALARLYERGEIRFETATYLLENRDRIPPRAEAGDGPAQPPQKE